MHKNYKLSKNAIFVWRARFTVLFIFLFFLCGCVFVFNSTLSIIFGVGISIIYIFAVTIYSALLFSNYFYTFNEGFICINKGVFFKKIYNISYNKILYFECMQTPFQAYKKIYCLIIHTAGSRIVIDGITYNCALEIRKNRVRK